MELIHSTFQASFDARIERLAEQETRELREIFRYFDTDGDGAVSADQAFRIFQMLGLDVNPAFVRELGDVYLAEFLKIVDSHVPASVEPSTQLVGVVPPLATPMHAKANDIQVDGTTAEANPAGLLDEESLQRRNARIWGEEWRVIDSYRRGFVTRDELRFFLKSCFSPFPLQDLDRFLELYSDSSMPADSDTLTKASFIKFRRDYTARERAQSDQSHSSDEDDEEQESEQVELDVSRQNVLGETSDSEPRLDAEAHRASVLKRRGSHRSSISHVPIQQGSSEVDEIVIDPGALEDDFVQEDEAVGDDDMSNLEESSVGDDDEQEEAE